MYSIIQAFGINYAENSSIIKQIKKPETGDTAGSPSEGMDSVGSLDPAEGPERKGGTVCNSRHAQKRPRPDGSEGLSRPLSPASAGLSHHIGSSFFFVIKTLLPLPGILFHQGLELRRAAMVCKGKGCTLGVEQEGGCEDGAQLEQARVSGRRHS